MALSINWENGSLYDIGQKEQFGTGKNDAVLAAIELSKMIGRTAGTRV
jgi:heterodisulfide reductase subunit A-like polyferredoxin